MKLRYLFSALCLCLLSASVYGQGRLQLHFMNVGQGDGAILISPRGQTVLFDNGWARCDSTVAYLQSLGITSIDYMIISHYDADHLGCTEKVLRSFPLGYALDRGGKPARPTPAFLRYVRAVRNKRLPAMNGMVIRLDAGTRHPVKIHIEALNGNGIATSNENDLSLTAVIRFGRFDAVIAGDLGGFDTGRYMDIESSVARSVGPVEVYKVNHHGSRYSSNWYWLRTIQPIIAVISVGAGNVYGHPAPETVQRLHAFNIRTYWTEVGAGATPDPRWDVVANSSIVVQAWAGSHFFTVASGYNAFFRQHTYRTWF